MKLTSIFLSLVFFFSFVCGALVPVTQGQVFAAPSASDTGDSDKDSGGDNKDEGDDGNKDKNKDEGDKETSSEKPGRIFVDYDTCVAYLDAVRGNVSADKLKENIEKKIDKRLSTELQYKDTEKTKVVLNNYAALEDRIAKKADVIPDEHEEVLKSAIESDKKQLEEIKSSLKSEKDVTKLKSTLCSVIYDYYRTRAYQVVYVVALDTIINASDRVEAVINSELNQVPESKMAEQMKVILTEAAKPVEAGEAQAVKLRDQLLALGSKTGSDKEVRATIGALKSVQVKNIVNSVKESVVRFDGIRAAVAIANGKDPAIESSEVQTIFIDLLNDKGVRVKSDPKDVKQVVVALSLIDKKNDKIKKLIKKLKKVEDSSGTVGLVVESGGSGSEGSSSSGDDSGSSGSSGSTGSSGSSGSTGSSGGSGFGGSSGDDGGSGGGNSGGGNSGGDPCAGLTPTACTGGYGGNGSRCPEGTLYSGGECSADAYGDLISYCNSEAGRKNPSPDCP